MNNTVNDIAEECGIKFYIPAGIRLRKDPPITYEIGCMYCTKNENVMIDVYADRYNQNIPEHMRKNLLDTENTFTIIKDIAPVETNGLTGYDVIYKDLHHEYYEVNYKSPKNFNDAHLIIVITCDVSKGNINKALSRTDVRELLDSVRNVT